MLIVMAAKCNVALDPKKGWLTFSSPQGTQGFKIASEAYDLSNPMHAVRKIEMCECGVLERVAR